MGLLKMDFNHVLNLGLYFVHVVGDYKVYT